MMKKIYLSVIFIIFLSVFSIGILTSYGVSAFFPLPPGPGPPPEDNLAWWCDKVNAERIWGGYEDAKDVKTDLHGGGINVCIIDSGCDYTHLDLDYNYVSGWDFDDDDDDPMDDEDNYYHGTRVAGIIAMEDNEVGYIGIAPNVSLYILRIHKDLITSQILDALDWAINTLNDSDPDNDINIISMSVGGFRSQWQDWEINKIGAKLNQAYNNDIVLVAAAGNYYDYPDYPTEVMFPACHPKVIAVGAINRKLYRANISNTGYWGSCYGPELELVAPGVDIISTEKAHTWDTDSGTSFACPIVTGVIALMLTKEPLYLTPEHIRTILHNTATKVGGVTYENGWHEEYGYGMVDAEAAVNAV